MSGAPPALELAGIDRSFGAVRALPGAHLAVRRFAPNADPGLLPVTFVLAGVGLGIVTRLDATLAASQVTWLFIGVAALVLTLVAIAALVTFMKQQVASPPPPTRVVFTLPSPTAADRAVYDAFFGCPVAFGERQTRVRIPLAYLALMLTGLPICVFLPTHRLLGMLFRPGDARPGFLSETEMDCKPSA